MRIADTLLRRGHLSEDALIAAWYSGDCPAHLDACDLCAERALDVSHWLEQTRELGIAEADAVFPAERLAAQQTQILRRLEQLDRPSKLLSFPRVAAAPAGHHDFVSHERHHFAGWVAAALAAGLILGVIGGRLSTWQPNQQSVRTAAVAAATKAAKTAETSRASDQRAYLLLESDVSQPQIHSLSALDAMTPQVTVARASDRRR